MKKHYSAPEAKLITFAPCEHIASGWDTKDSWKVNGFFWKSNDLTIPENGPSGTHYWYDFGTDEIEELDS